MKKRRLCCYGVPRELVEQILLKLPVKSMVRFRSVCKDWNTVIGGEKFVKDHLQLQASKAPCSMLLGWAKGGDLALALDKKQVLSLLSAVDSIESTVVKEEFNLRIHPPILVHWSDCIRSLKGSHCNGIACLVDWLPYISERVLLYNPALREHKFIETTEGMTEMERMVAWGFGHDLKTDDYKFVMLLEHASAREVAKAEVYTLRTGRWTEIEFRTRRTFPSYPGTYLKGRLYWHNSTDEDCLVWFDMSDESFGKIDLPRPQDSKWTRLPLLVWNGSLVYFNNVGDSFTMWVMDGEDGGWSEYCRLGFLAGVAMPIAFWKEDELLMMHNESVVPYNLDTKELQKLPIPVSAGSSITFGSLYAETLVSVKPSAFAKT